MKGFQRLKLSKNIGPRISQKSFLELRSLNPCHAFFWGHFPNRTYSFKLLFVVQFENEAFVEMKNFDEIPRI